MKKTIAIIAILLLIAGAAYARMTVVGIAGMVSSGGPPSFYNATNVVLSWDGDSPLGTNYAYKADGTALEGINTNLEISTSYGAGGSNGAIVDTADERIIWTDSGGTLVDVNATGTIWARIYETADIDAVNMNFFECVYAADTDRINVYVNPSITRLYGVYVGGSTSANALVGSIPNSSWIDVAYSWDRPNGDHAVYYTTWEGNEDLDEIGAITFASDVTAITLGNLAASQIITAGAVYVTQWAITSDYMGTKPW